MGTIKFQCWYKLNSIEVHLFNVGTVQLNIGTFIISVLVPKIFNTGANQTRQGYFLFNDGTVRAQYWCIFTSMWVNYVLSMGTIKFQCWYKLHSIEVHLFNVGAVQLNIGTFIISVWVPKIFNTGANQTRQGYFLFNDGTVTAQYWCILTSMWVNYVLSMGTIRFQCWYKLNSIEVHLFNVGTVQLNIGTFIISVWVPKIFNNWCKSNSIGVLLVQ